MKNILVLLIACFLAAACLINGCGEDLYAVKAMREKQAQVSSGSRYERNYNDSAATEEAPASTATAPQKTSGYKDPFLYEKEAPLKAEKDLKDETSAAAKPKPEPAIAASGPKEMRRLGELRAEDEKKAVAAGKPLPRKIERSDVGLTDPINVPKSQGTAAITPPAELLKPIVIDKSEKIEDREIVPSSPKKETASADAKVNAELKKLASKIEHKPSVVLPKEDSAETPAPQPKAAPVAAAATSKETVPATGYDWNKLSAAKKEEAPAAAATPAKPAEKPAPVVAVAAPKPAPVVEAPKKVEAPATVVAPTVKTPVPAVTAKKEEKPADKSWELEFVEKPEPTKVTLKPGPAKTAPAVAVKPAEPKANNWGLPEKETPKEPVTQTPTVTKPEAPATVEIKLADAFAPEKVESAAKPKETPLPTTTAKPVRITTDETPKASAPLQVAVAAPKPKISPAKPAPVVVKPAPAPVVVDIEKENALKEAAARKAEVNELTKQAQALRSAGNHKDAIKTLSKILDIEPENLWAQDMKKDSIESLERAEQEQKEKDVLKPAAVAAKPAPAPVAINADDKRKVEIMTKQVQILTSEGRNKEAVEVLDKILAIDPNNVWAQDMKKNVKSRMKYSDLDTAKTSPAKPAVTVTTPVAKPTPAPVAAAPKPAPKKAVVEPVFGTNEDRTFKGWPGAGMILKSGMDRLLNWMPDTAANFSNLRLMFSSDGGRSWKTVASDMKQGSIAAWTVPVVTSENCRLKIVGTDEAGQDVTLAISEQFSVNTGVWETVDSAAVK